jgi:uncharacterized repeat protein (TIGR03847 family)
MTASFDLTAPHHFTAGTIGDPGQRVFFVQAAEGAIIVTLKLEKTQVAALAQYMAELLADLPPVPDEEIPRDVELLEPAIAEWVVGTIGVAFDENRDRMVVTFQEIQEIQVVGDEEAAEAVAMVADDDASLATFTVTRPQAMGFVRRAAELVASGRPPCTLCGRPLDPEGHVCIKTNGHLPH